MTPDRPWGQANLTRIDIPLIADREASKYWDNADTVFTPKQIDEMQRQIYLERYLFDRKDSIERDKTRLNRVISWDREHLAEVLGVEKLPKAVKQLWEAAEECTTVNGYDEWVSLAEKINPYQDKKYKAGSIEKVRLIGWSYFVLDFARREALARAINNLPEYEINIWCQRIGDIGPKYWDESSDWSTWVRGEMRDPNLEKESQLAEWISARSDTYRTPKSYSIYHGSNRGF